MAIRFRYETPKGAFAEGMTSMADPVAAAGTAAITEAGDIVKQNGRADIAKAGFSRRWQNALRVEVYPKRRNSMNAAAFIFHNIVYAGIFEEGGRIDGKPMLWLPLPDTPKRIGRQKMTPALYRKSIGPLVLIKRPGKAPLLAGQIATKRGGGTSKVSLAALRRGSSGKASKLVPLFVGVKAVSIRDRFSIKEITERAAGQLGALYVKHLNVE